MLRQRILTALVLIPVFIGTLFLLPSAGLAVVFGLVMAIGATEWARLAALPGGRRWGYMVALVAAGAAVVALVLMQTAPLRALLAAAVLFWVFALYALARAESRAHQMLFVSLPGKLAGGFLVLTGAWLAAVALHQLDPRRPAVLLYVFVLVWTADTFAYFAGHKWGRHKLAPAVSPGKTIEGVVAGIAGVLALAYGAGHYFWGWRGRELGLWLGLSLATGLFSVLGDLVESKYKRIAGVKDSGAILPGHGGVLDRIDALTAALPVFALGWLLLFGGAP